MDAPRYQKAARHVVLGLPFLHLARMQMAVKARKLSLFLRLRRRRDDGPVANADDLLHYGIRDLNRIALALFGWFLHGVNLPCQPCLEEIIFQSSPLPLC